MVVIKKGRYQPGTKKYRVAAAKRLANRRAMARPSKGLKLQVDRLIEGRQETKFVLGAPWGYDSSTDLETWTAFTSAINTTNEVYSLIPKISQGTDDCNRIGQQIQPVSLNTKVNLALESAHSASVYVDVFFCTSKTVKSANNTSGVVWSKLLNAGDGTNVGYDGTSYTSMLPINKSEFSIVARRRIKLEKATGNPNYDLSTTLGGSSTNTYKYVASINQKIRLPQRLVYEAASSQYPSNHFPFMMIGFCGTDTNGQYAPITARVWAQAQSHFYYKDA